MAAFRKRQGIYYVRYVDDQGKQRERKSGRDLATAKALARKLESETAKIKAGLVDRAASKTLTDYKAEYLQELRAKGRGSKYINQCSLYIDRMFNLGKMEKPGDVDKTHVLRAFAALKATGSSATTLNRHLTVIRSIAIRMGKPLNDLRGFSANQKADRRLVRRALSEQEVNAILAYLDSDRARRREQVDASDRKHLYLLALSTGLRKSEIMSLTPGSFDLDTAIPVVVCDASHTKNGVTARQPLPLGLVGAFRRYLQGKPHDRPIWRLPQHSARMLRKDCRDAGVDPTNVDIHALRHTFITRLALSNTPPAVLKRLARHHSLDLTLNVYTHVHDKDAADALAIAHPFSVPTQGGIEGGGRRPLSAIDLDANPIRANTLRPTAEPVGEPADLMLYQMPAVARG